MRNAFLLNYIRTPIGRYAGALAPVRPDDLAALTMAAVVANSGIDPATIDEIYYGDANQAGEDNRNVARMSGLLAGLPVEVPGSTVNRLCGSGMEAIGLAARAVEVGAADVVLAGGVESMSRAPKVMSKAGSAFDRAVVMHDSTIGWRFVNPKMRERFGADEMPGTAENVAAEFAISREDQDAFAYRSQQRTEKARSEGFFAGEIVGVEIPRRRRDPLVVETDEHPRPDTSLEKLSRLKPIFENGTVTAGNASGINDGAASALVVSEAVLEQLGATPMARILGMATAGVPPRIMGIGPVPSTTKLLDRLGMALSDFGAIELNEAFASQALACLREFGLPDDADHVNPNGGAIALGHPLGMSGARLVGTVAREMARRDEKYGLATMCIGVGQGIAMALERVE
ncbi:MAG: 3-oxoadipyl-CoA thiolase [Actinomycetota bacterium]|nr:3-oxoadipyl-CoA thiolase [Actinomycetota bacterium]MDK1016631.1 3-oxoadipyl-CoA thiolase [Actinomycetota bacterium]MDK1027005.1 3-oxoadipyl-CoA thiolase [Actinomycetota bacterium]MDK1038479.1 3-oxoadipyl-CoA thiolase [Actinomycetota bacterium]MDK1096325.1 3-oxoadipyl-CoA thiolase [Actinomycetota bacterium]